MRYNGAISGLVGHMDRIKSFCQRSDLIEPDQDCIGRLKLDPTADPPGVRYKQIISYQLNILTQTTGKLLPAFPVIFPSSIDTSGNSAVNDS